MKTSNSPEFAAQYPKPCMNPFIPWPNTHHSFDATAILEYRQTLKASGGELSGVTIGDMILFAVSRVLLNHPDLNANIVQENSLRCFKHVHLGVAVDTPRGLMVPTIFNCDEKSLLEISSEVKKLASLCKAVAGPSPGGSFTVQTWATSALSFTPLSIRPDRTGRMLHRNAAQTIGTQY